MNWLERLSRNLGLMVHHIKHPEASSESQSSVTQVSKKVEEKAISPTTTLRRTVIEEVEIKHDGKQ